MYSLHPYNKGFSCKGQNGVFIASSNLDDETRYFPNIEFLAQWFADLTEKYGDHLSPRKILPRSGLANVSSDPRVLERVSQIVVDDGEVELGLLDDIVLPQPSG